MSYNLNIVTFDVPYPADYGGAIDVFFKLKALHKLGIKITLHCFEYGNRKRQEELSNYCDKVYYYKRSKLKGLIYLFKLPYIVSSRKNAELLNNLTQNNHPILFEGLHSCVYLPHEKLRKRVKFVRMHNIEWQYYKQLYKNETSLVKKLYFLNEYKNLLKYETVLKYATTVLSISLNDEGYLTQKLYETSHIMPFHQNNNLQTQIGKGNYLLYHGNLSVNENENAAIFLIQLYKEYKIKYPLIIAGKNPSNKLINQIKRNPLISLINNPNNEEITELIQQAHINILPTFQQSGVKLKLINALFNGRFCLVNNNMVYGTQLHNCCEIANSDVEFNDSINRLMKLEFTNSISVKTRYSIKSKV